MDFLDGNYRYFCMEKKILGADLMPLNIVCIFFLKK